MLPDEKLKIYDKGIELKNIDKNKIWEYRIGKVETPYVPLKESLNIMLKTFFKFANGSRVETDIYHIKKVFKLHELIKKKN